MPDITYLRNHTTNRIAEEIASLPGPVFEQWGYRFMHFLQPDTVWHHRGTTIAGSPRKSTVDSAGDHAKYVVQYSSEKNYFESDKPIKDLDSSLDKHPTVKHIWLLAGVEASPSGATETDEEIRKWKANHANIAVTSLGARQIAAFIADRLDSDSLIESLEPEIPSLKRLAEESAFGHSMPLLGNHVLRSELLKEARILLEQHRYVILAGISGSGKSDLAVKLVQKMQVESAGWIDATGVRKASEIQAIPVARRGLSLNVAYLLRERSWIIVLDNLPAPWSPEVLRQLVGEHSYLIITSQNAGTRDDVLEVGNLSKGDAKQVLEIDSNSPCPPDVFQDIWRATEGHPLLLRILGRLVNEHRGAWSIARDCCESIISHGQDEEHEKVCRRVLRQHLAALEDELNFFRWCGSPSADTALVRACVSPFASPNLKKRHLLAAASDRAIRLHDIVFLSATTILEVKPTDVLRYRQRLDDLLASEATAHTLLLDRISRRHTDLFARELARQRSWELLYALARSRVSGDLIAIFGDLHSAAVELGPTQPQALIAVRAIVEAIEATHSLTAEHSGAPAAKKRLQELMPVFETLRSKPFPTALGIDIRHHWAKMLVRLDKKAEAEAAFRAILNDNPEHDAAILQLVRLVGQRRSGEPLNDQRKQEALNLALALVQSSNEHVSLTVRISAWVELAQLDQGAVVRRIDEVIKTLEGLRDVDVLAAYGLVAQLVSALAYTNPETALVLFETIKDNEPVFSSSKERCDWARAQVGAAKALSDTSKQPESNHLLLRARDTYRSVPRQQMPLFYFLNYAESLILLSDFNGAKEVLEGMPGQRRNEFWWHRLAQVEKGLGNLDVAEDAINTALDEVDDEKYVAAFLEVKADIKYARQDVAGARVELEAAIACANGDKYQNQLRRKRDQWQSIS